MITIDGKEMFKNEPDTMTSINGVTVEWYTDKSGQKHKKIGVNAEHFRPIFEEIFMNYLAHDHMTEHSFKEVLDDLIEALKEGK